MTTTVVSYFDHLNKNIYELSLNDRIPVKRRPHLIKLHHIVIHFYRSHFSRFRGVLYLLNTILQTLVIFALQ